MLRKILDKYGRIGRQPTLAEVKEFFEDFDGDYEELKDSVEERLDVWLEEAEEEKEGQEGIESDYRSSISLN